MRQANDNYRSLSAPCKYVNTQGVNDGVKNCSVIYTIRVYCFSSKLLQSQPRDFESHYRRPSMDRGISLLFERVPPSTNDCLVHDATAK
jgi:hypothetical protein